jgi:hypothetical protein
VARGFTVVVRINSHATFAVREELLMAIEKHVLSFQIDGEKRNDAPFRMTGPHAHES